MKIRPFPALSLSLTAALLLSSHPHCARAEEAAKTGPLRFQITLPREVLPAGASGRLLVFLSDSAEPRRTLGTGFIPGSTWIAAMEVTHLGAGATIEMNPDAIAYPQPFSSAKPGHYQVMALLDQNHSYAYNGEGPGDLKSDVVSLDALNPADTAPVALSLSKLNAPEARPADTDSIKLIEFESPSLSKFWGRPIHIQAGVVLPPTYGTDPKTRFPTVYHLHGFGGDHRDAWAQGPFIGKGMTEGRVAPMIHVFLNSSCPGGAHQFADSVNNGPWGSALVGEFIPHLDKTFRTVAKPGARFLTGHSSGGWASLWLQVTYPDFFGGTWSTAPDPVDLRSYTGINATPGSTDNAYRDASGQPRQLVRQGERWVASIEQFARQEAVTGEYGGQFASFEWVWSPRGPDGRPMPLFNRQTGVLDPAVLEAWQQYDIRLVLEKNWATLGPKLKGKLHVFCGELDTFRLNEGVSLLGKFFTEKHADAVCELVPGRSHGTLFQPYETYPQGLMLRIDQEMAAAFAASQKAPR